MPVCVKTPNCHFRSTSVQPLKCKFVICHLTIIKEIFVFISHCSEKANLAVTLSTAKSEVLAHASFSDHPTEELVDQACWENLLQSHVNGEKFTVSKANKPRCPLIINIYFLQPPDSLVSLFSSP